MNKSTYTVWLHQKLTVSVFCLVFPLLILLSSCAKPTYIETLREAQETFSRAAEAENRQRLGESTGISDVAGAATGYRVVAQTLANLISKEKDELQKDNLLCTAYVVQAMSLWRLGDYQEALGIVDLAQNCAPGNDESQIPPRERALLRALPGLVRIDQANAKVGDDKHGTTEFENIKQLVNDAINKDLQAARNSVPQNHPVQSYLLTSELAAILVWQTAIASEKLQGNARTDAWNELKPVKVKKYKEYRDFLINELGVEKNDSRIHYWAKKLAIPENEI